MMSLHMLAPPLSESLSLLLSYCHSPAGSDDVHVDEFETDELRRRLRLNAQNIVHSHCFVVKLDENLGLVRTNLRRLLFSELSVVHESHDLSVAGDQ